jgi:ferredoxin--NADP+ reductase
MLTDVSTLLDARGLAASPGIGAPGDYVIERSFVVK